MSSQSLFETTDEDMVKSFLILIQAKSSKYAAVMFHTSKLMVYNRQAPQLQKMLADVEEIFKQFNAQCFLLKNEDIVCIFEKHSQIHIERAISQFKRAVPKDPVLTDSHKRELFVTPYDLGAQWREFCVEIADIQDRPLASIQKPDGSGETSPLIIDGLRVETLSMIEGILKQADITNYIRRQTVGCFNGKSSFEPMMQHFYISLKSLQSSLKISEPLEGNAWLFKQLTFYLDRQMMKNLVNILQLRTLSSVSINLSLRTLVTTHFHDFMKKYSGDMELTLFFDIVDLMVHPDVFLYAQELLKTKNIRIGFNNITMNHMQYVNLANIPCNYFKIDSKSLLSTPYKDAMRDIIRQRGDSSVILHKCDSEKTIVDGYASGIQLYQGAFIDKIIAKNKPLVM